MLLPSCWRGHPPYLYKCTARRSSVFTIALGTRLQVHRDTWLATAMHFSSPCVGIPAREELQCCEECEEGLTRPECGEDGPSSARVSRARETLELACLDFCRLSSSSSSKASSSSVQSYDFLSTCCLAAKRVLLRVAWSSGGAESAATHSCRYIKFAFKCPLSEISKPWKTDWSKPYPNGNLYNWKPSIRDVTDVIPPRGTVAKLSL